MKVLLTTLFAVLLAGGIMSQKTDFSGTWKINLVKSDYGNTPPNSLAGKLVITQSTNEISIERLWVKEDKESGFTETLKYNGKPAESKINGSVPIVSTITWAQDGKSFTQLMKVMNDNNEVRQTITQVNTLIDDGKALRLDQTLNVGGEDIKMKIIYEK